MTDFQLILDIEAEFGPLPQLAARFRSEDWSVGELVGLLQMIGTDPAAETPVDFLELGNRLLENGLLPARCRLMQFFEEVLGAPRLQ